jgi:subtilisin family serine protease
MKKYNYLIISLLLISISLFGQTYSSKMSPTTRIFLREKAHFADSVNRNVLKSRFLLKSINDVEYVSCMLKLHDTGDLDNLRALGVQINTVLTSIITARVPVNQIEAVAALPNVERIEIAAKAYRTLNAARASANVNHVQNGIQLPEETPFMGKDVIVGVIDGGFEYGHINFYDSTGTNLRVKRVWNQMASGTRPAGYTYGAEYATTANILAARYDDPSDTHATHVTGIAAGAYNKLNYWGVAPEADIVMVAMNYYDNSAEHVSLIDGINYIYNYATSVNKPAVVNMSLGLHMGPHDGTSLFDIACDDMQGAGRLLVGAAGNEGDDTLHVSKTFAATDTLKTFVRSHGGMSYVDVNVWGEAGKNMKVQMVIFNTSQRKVLYATDFVDASQSNDRQFNLSSSSGASGRVYISTEQYSSNNRPSAYIQTDYNFRVNNGNVMGIRVISDEGATVHAWTFDNVSYFTNNGLPDSYGWQDGDLDYSVGEIGGTGNKIISVGAYTSKNQYRPRGSSVYYPTGETVNNIASFSSNGPTVDGRLKPDIAAPGTLLISSFNSMAVKSQNSDFYSSITNLQTIGGKDYYFGVMEGTSMSSPFVAGVLALWLQANPQLTPDDIRMIFSETAKSDTYTGTAPNNTWGYGKIDAWAGILNVLSTLTADENIVTQKLVYIKNPVENAAEIIFGYSDRDVNLYLMDMNGKLILHKQIPLLSENQSVTITETANLPTGNYIFYYQGKEKRGAKKIIVK